ncbi:MULTISPECIES: hypothetical protein [Streptococcus]|uniref:Uncharacterized protein n=1 Tax=Streptococcus caledonicus TaxID=2614158 RepID=A0ABW0UDB4_9STRE|nr:hypothetical protein [Streptococcus sp. S784/96/1]
MKEQNTKKFVALSAWQLLVQLAMSITAKVVEHFIIELIQILIK